VFVDVAEDFPPLKVMWYDETGIALTPNNINRNRFHSIGDIFTPKLNVTIVHLRWDKDISFVDFFAVPVEEAGELHEHHIP